MISTNIPPGEVDRFISLALQARGQKISTVSLVPPMVVTAHPDVPTIKAMVAAAIARAEGRTPTKPADAEPGTTLAAPADTPTSEAPADTPASTPADTTSQAPTEPAAQPEVVTGGSVGNLSDGYAANQTDDLGASC